jgi:hypothetical protein
VAHRKLQLRLLDTPDKKSKSDSSGYACQEDTLTEGISLGRGLNGLVEDIVADDAVGLLKFLTRLEQVKPTNVSTQDDGPTPAEEPAISQTGDSAPLLTLGSPVLLKTSTPYPRHIPTSNSLNISQLNVSEHHLA